MKYLLLLCLTLFGCIDEAYYVKHDYFLHPSSNTVYKYSESGPSIYRLEDNAYTHAHELCKNGWILVNQKDTLNKNIYTFTLKYMCSE